MKALIFAAGLGTRLYPLTASRPKALVEVGGVPMLQRVIERVKAAGVTEIVVNVHHFADMIIDFLASNKNFGVEIWVSDERDKLLETGGGLLKARPMLDGTEPILIHNADILTDLDLNRLTPDEGVMATLLVSDRHSSRQLVFDRQTELLKGWLNTSSGETRPDGFEYDSETDICRSFNGIHIVRPEIFPILAEYSVQAGSEAFSITPFYLYCAERGLPIQGRSVAGYQWFDIGKPESLAAARAAAHG